MKRVIFIGTALVVSLFAFCPMAICQDFAFTGPMNYWVGYSPWNINGDDLNGDGLVDLFTANRDGSVSVFLNLGNGIFQTAINISVMSLPYGICSADLDNDGDKDLIIANHNSQGSITILINNGTGNFATGPSYLAGSYGWSVTASDLDIDGRIDIIFSTEISATNYIFHNEENLLFELQESHFTGNSSHQVVASDLNKDGYPDLVVAGGISNIVSIMLNRQDGTFGSPTFYSSGNNVISVIVADFDNDGDKDLAPINYHGCSFLTTFNAGNGSFGPGQSFSYSELPTFGVAADLNRDGWKDLIITRQSYGPNIRIMRNQGSGTFVLGAELTTGSLPLGVYADDFDNDGDIDIATANLGTSDISILLNLGITGIDPGQSIIPAEYALNQNYPNPFNAKTTIGFDLPRDSFAKLEIYNILGNRLATLVNEYMPAGHHQVIWSGDKSATGIYYGKLTAGDYNSIIKMTMLK